ncbi:hypothetical protein [Aurantiacibacter marinus]|uniref:hypothetical protein n=1 Tax=Aurantiacibacter marinus TaxID=874156 RepID=UPI000699D135|nr:hypothetical protein [Aurantiacibacter marinus]
MKYLVTAISALALAASPAIAQGNGNGAGNGNANGAGNANGNRGGASQQADRGSPGNGNAQNRNRGEGQRGGQGSNQRPDNRGGNADRGNTGRGNQAQPDRARGNATGGSNRNDRNRADRDRNDGLIDRIFYRETGIIDGCPPGLAAKRNGCLPPGQARQRDRTNRFGRNAPNWWGLPYQSGNFFYDDGVLLRYDGNRVSGYIPLLGGALAIGNPWPRGYGNNRVPDYESRFYGLGDNYRYADNVVYRLDPQTAAITSIAALLTGNEFVVGQAAPQGYDVYNVPYGQRERYRDTPDAYYRYNDGYVYRIDPETRLVAAAFELLL